MCEGDTKPGNFYKSSGFKLQKTAHPTSFHSPLPQTKNYTVNKASLVVVE